MIGAFETALSEVGARDSSGFYPFHSWSALLAYAHTGGPLYYQAPLNLHPVRVRYEARPRTVRIFPPGSTGRGRVRTSDPFTADRHHLNRFYRPGGARGNPVPSELLVAGAVLGLVGVGVLVFRTVRAAQPAAGKSWKEVTPPNFKAGGVYRVTMNPVGGKTVDDEASEIASRIANNAQGGSAIVIDGPYDASWIDQDAGRWHFEVVATKDYDASAVGGIRVWEWS